MIASFPGEAITIKQSKQDGKRTKEGERANKVKTREERLWTQGEEKESKES
jgi:hypothetical protein